MKINTLNKMLFVCIVLSSAFGCVNRNSTLKLTSEALSKGHLHAEVFVGDAKECSRIYHNNSILVVEVHCNGNPIKSGIYIIDATGTKAYGWYDKNFNTWAWEEGCNDKISCFYEAVVDSTGKVTELRYNFYINLSEGFYKIIVKENALEVIDKGIIDSPS